VAGRQGLRGNLGRTQTSHSIHRHRSFAAHGEPIQEAEKVKGIASLFRGLEFVYNPSVAARKFA